MIAARDALTVFVDGDELPGIMVYGLASRGMRTPRAAPDGVWPGAASIEEVSLHGERWEVVIWEIALAEWPARDAWKAAIRNALRAHIEAGCVVSWVGAEGIPFCDPPELFDVACMSGGVLAWMTADDADCPLDPDGELVPVDDRVLEGLRQTAGGLADAA